jgi:hypothetical protein
VRHAVEDEQQQRRQGQQHDAEHQPSLPALVRPVSHDAEHDDDGEQDHQHRTGRSESGNHAEWP